MAGKGAVRIPRKLERYLTTIARRKNIESIIVALVVIFDGGILISDEGALPSRSVESAGIAAAISAMMASLGLRGSVRYLGHADRDGKRKYLFAVEPEARPEPIHGRMLEATEAAGLLSRREAKLIASLFGKPPALQQLLSW